jgi:Fic family protein
MRDAVMRLPRKPPIGADDFIKIISESPEKGIQLMQAATSPPDRYLHWDKLRHYALPIAGITHAEWWAAIKFKRFTAYKILPLWDKLGNQFKYASVDPIPAMLHKIDLGAGGLIQMPDQITNPETRDQYCVGSLIEEAITSSQLEGATTTRPVAKEMIRTGRPPRDKSERMILNNFLTMQKIVRLKKEPLTKEMVFDIHRIVTDQTMDHQGAVGRFRNEGEDVRVEGPYGEVYHVPPAASSLEGRMESMCDFANGLTPNDFLHPVLRSIAIHFWLSYDHPFVDGNGRTARALFYWSMLHHNYWLCEFLSISHIIRKAPVKYGRAFLYSETDDNDMTYFVLYHLHVIQRAIQELHDYITRKTSDLRKLEMRLRGMDALNHRQRALIGHALRHPNQRYTIESHRVSHNVVYQTARTDLLDLCAKGLLGKRKAGKAWVFVPERGLEQKLEEVDTR